MKEPTACYHLVRLTNCEGRTWDFIFNDESAARERLNIYKKQAESDKKFYSADVTISDKRVYVSMFNRYGLARFAGVFWEAELFCNLGFETA